MKYNQPQVTFLGVYLNIGGNFNDRILIKSYNNQHLIPNRLPAKVSMYLVSKKLDGAL